MTRELLNKLYSNTYKYFQDAELLNNSSIISNEYMLNRLSININIIIHIKLSTYNYSLI